MTSADGGRLLLVRHAMPVIDPQSPAEQWRLGAEGRAAARALAPLIAEPAAYYVSSPEPKAFETLREIAPQAPIEADPGFAEVRRPRAWTDDVTYRTAARAYVEGADQDGWEPRDEVIARFDAAVARHAAQAAARHAAQAAAQQGIGTVARHGAEAVTRHGAQSAARQGAEAVAREAQAASRHGTESVASRGTLVIGTHGLAPTVWLAAKARLLPSPGDFWASLRFPDLIEVDLRRYEVRRRH